MPKSSNSEDTLEDLEDNLENISGDELEINSDTDSKEHSEDNLNENQ